MDLISIGAAVVWVDFFTILLSKYVNLGTSLNMWYDQFGIVAVLSDCLVIVLGIMIAQLFFPNYNLLVTVVLIQIVHDIMFYLFVIKPIPTGSNQMIDLFKSYASENSYKILIADSIMMISTVLLAQQLRGKFVPFIGLLGVYALTYIIYTK
jgi:hypothetical protein